MMKQFKSELYRISRSALLLGMTAVLLMLCLFVNGSRVPGVFNYIAKDTPYFHLEARDYFIQETAGMAKHYTLPVYLEKHHYYDETSVETMDDFYNITVPRQYMRVMWYCGGNLFLLLLLPMALIFWDRSRKVPYLRGRLSGSYQAVALAKIGVCYLIVALISVCNSLLIPAFFFPEALSLLGFGYKLRCILQRLLCDMMLISLPMFVAFSVDKAVLAALLNLLLSVGFVLGNVLAARCTSILYLPIPGLLQGMRGIWEKDAPVGAVLFAFVCSLAYVIVFSWLSCRAFEKQAKQFFEAY